MRDAFEADEGGFEADEDAIVWQVPGGGHFLTLQRNSESSGEDWGVYLEFDDQANCGYECIRAIHLSPRSVTVELSRQLGDLPDVSGFDVTLRVSSEV